MEESATLAALAPRLRGSTVALVGNARGLSESNHGAEIDGCGLVVRLNAAPQREAKSHGMRTDWLAASTPLPAGRLRELVPCRMIWMSPRHRACATLRYGWRVPMSFYPRGWWRQLAATLESRPSTGMMVIDLLLRVGGWREVRLFGFDFFASGSLSGRRIAAPVPHDFAREEAHVRRLIADGRAIRIMECSAPC